MIVVVKRNNILLIGLVFLLMITVYSLNIGDEASVSVTKSPQSQKTVILDAGHGGEDPGAVSDYSRITEKELNLDIAIKVKKLLEDEGYGVILTREEDRLNYNEDAKSIFQKRKQDLTARKKVMDESGAGIVVSIHMNKFQQTQYKGAQTFFPPNSPQSQKLAMSIQSKLKEIVDPSNERASLVKKEPIVILRNLKTTTAIVECGFLSNQEEEKKLQQNSYREQLALAIKEGIAAYFK